ncbi:MAG: hypothetical protein LBG92_01340 [Prevotellaceae bacterium]|nr:hypothetical protein [Prevotellaceae bacterium]
MTIKSKDWVQCGDVPDDNDVESSSAVEEKGLAYCISHYYENDTYIYFIYNKGRHIYNIQYNKHTQSVYRYKSMINDMKFNDETSEDFYSYPVLLKSVNSQFAYNVGFSSEALRDCYKENILSPSLAKQVAGMNLPEEGYVLMEYELK